MKKFTLTAFAILLLGFTNKTVAQNFLPIKDIHYRVEGGINLTNIKNVKRGDVEPTSNKTGLRLGGVAELDFHKYIFATAGLFYNMGGASQKHDTFTKSIRTQALTLPLNAGGRIALTSDISLSLETGPFFQYLLSAKRTKTKIKGAEKTTDLFEDGTFKHFNMGWGLSVAGEYKNYIFRVGSEWGLKDFSVDDDETTSSEVFISIGYRF